MFKVKKSKRNIPLVSEKKKYLNEFTYLHLNKLTTEIKT